MKTNDIKDTQKIDVGKMCFVIEEEQPDNVTDEVKNHIEQELFKVFRKYEYEDS